MPPRRTRFNQDQYALLRRCAESMDFTEWNRWYAEYLADNLFLRSTDSYGAHLAGAELSGANLSHVHLEGADLWQANLTGADLRYAELGGANLADAKKEKALF